MADDRHFRYSRPKWFPQLAQYGAPGRMESDIPIRLKIPQQDLPEFTQFELRPDAARDWAHRLSITNTWQSLQQLQQALSDLNRVAMPPDTRYRVMEAVLPALETALKGAWFYPTSRCSWPIWLTNATNLPALPL